MLQVILFIWNFRRNYSYWSTSSVVEVPHSSQLTAPGHRCVQVPAWCGQRWSRLRLSLCPKWLPVLHQMGGEAFTFPYYLSDLMPDFVLGAQQLLQQCSLPTTRSVLWALRAGAESELFHPTPVSFSAPCLPEIGSLSTLVSSFSMPVLCTICSCQTNTILSDWPPVPMVSCRALPPPSSLLCCSFLDQQPPIPSVCLSPHFHAHMPCL